MPPGTPDRNGLAITMTRSGLAHSKAYLLPKANMKSSQILRHPVKNKNNLLKSNLQGKKGSRTYWWNSYRSSVIASPPQVKLKNNAIFNERMIRLQSLKPPHLFPRTKEQKALVGRKTAHLVITTCKK